MREASKRTLGMRHFDVQLVGGAVLHEGAIAEMKTGEGKTLVATLPLYLNALEGEGAHLVTVNDYLARRDAEWMRPIYEALGMTVGVIEAQMDQDARKAAYRATSPTARTPSSASTTCATTSPSSIEETVQRPHAFAIVDEVDSILVDEARTPLIIAGQPEESSDTYYTFAKIVKGFKLGEDYEVDEKRKTAAPTEQGVAKTEKALGIENLYAPGSSQMVNHLIQALRAESLYNNGVEYLVVDGEVKIVDEFTGRIMEGRRWSEGLHQAVEAKENVKIEAENVTVATVTIQNYFRLYEKLAGMTGTALTEANEFHEIYGLEVVPIPTNVPVTRVDAERPHLQDRGREVPRRRQRHRRAACAKASRCSSARSPSRCRSASPTCWSARASRTTCSTPRPGRRARRPRSSRTRAPRARSRSPPTWRAAASTSSSATAWSTRAACT